MAAISKELREMSQQPWFPIMMRELGYEPIKYGRWIEDEYGIPHCSECKAINNTVYRNFCPNCGAKMDEVEE